MERGRGLNARNSFEILQGMEDIDLDEEHEQPQQQQQVIPSFSCKDGNQFQTALCTSRPNRVYFGIQSAQQLCRVEEINTNNSHALISKKFDTTLPDWLRMHRHSTRFQVIFHNKLYPSPLVTAIIQALMLSYAQFRSNSSRSHHKFLYLARSYVLDIVSPDPNKILDLFRGYAYTVVVDIVHAVTLDPTEIKVITETDSIASVIFDQILGGTTSSNGWVWDEWLDFHHALKNSNKLTYAVHHPVLLPWRKRLDLIDSLVMKLHSPNNKLKDLIRDVLADMEMFEQDWEHAMKDDAPFISILKFHADPAGLEVDTSNTATLSNRYIKQRREPDY